MKKTYEDAKKLCRYFNAVIAGSILLVDAGLLRYRKVSDIDIFASTNQKDKIKAWLEDNGYTAYKTNVYGTNDYQFRKSPSSPAIHIIFVSTIPAVYDLPQLIEKKIRRGTVKDLDQCICALRLLRHEKITELQRNSAHQGDKHEN